MEQSDSEFVQHIPCEKCGSSDAAGIYTDGHTYCFSCNAYQHATEENQVTETTDNKSADFLGGDALPLA